MVKYKIAVIILSIMVVWQTYGQSAMNINQCLRKRIQELTGTDNASFSQQMPTIGWLNEIEIRTETDEWNFNRQRYLLRVTPNSAKKRKAQKNLYQSYVQQKNLEQDQLKEKFIEIAYREIIDHYESVHTLATQKELLVVLKDQEKVWQALSLRSSDFPKNWLEIKEEIAFLEAEIMQAEQTAKQEVFSNPIDWTSILNLDELSSILTQPSQNGFLINHQQEMLKQQMLEQEITLEQAEQKQILSFLQIEYSGPHTDPFSEKVSIGAGFQWPFSSDQKLKIQELQLEKELLQQEMVANKKWNEYKAKEQAKRLKQSIQQLQNTTSINNRLTKEIELIANRNNKKVGSNPIPLLYQKERQLKATLGGIASATKIYQEYIDYLILTEQLYQVPHYTHLGK